MYIVHFKGPQGPQTKHTLSIVDAIRSGAALEAAGQQGISIADHDGETMLLKWWQTVAAGV